MPRADSESQPTLHLELWTWPGAMDHAWPVAFVCKRNCPPKRRHVLAQGFNGALGVRIGSFWHSLFEPIVLNPSLAACSLQ